MDQEVAKYQVDEVQLRELYGKYCLLPYVRLFAECGDESDELVVKVINGLRSADE